MIHIISICSPLKLSNFQDPPPSPVHLRPKWLHPLELGRPILDESLPPYPPQQTMEQQLHRASEQTKSKQKVRHIQIDDAFYCLI